jgi:hypothetical protein
LIRRCVVPDVPTLVESYELTIATGNSGAFEGYGYSRATLVLLGKKGRRLASIAFHPPKRELSYDEIRDRTSDGEEFELFLPTDMLTSVLSLLESEKPVTLTYGEGSTRTPWGILTTTER